MLQTTAISAIARPRRRAGSILIAVTRPMVAPRAAATMAGIVPGMKNETIISSRAATAAPLMGRGSSSSVVRLLVTGRA